MPDSPPGFSIESLALPHEDPGELTRILKEFTDAYPTSDPIVQGLILQAVMALVEIRRLERIRATVRTEKVRTALLFWEQGNEDQVETYLQQFNRHPPSALVGLFRSAAGCRWALAFLERLQKLLNEEGTWYSDDMIGAIQIQGLSACLDDLYYSEQAFMTSIDCLAAQPAPKQKDIDRILDPAIIPKGLQDRDVPLWPRDPVECRARLQAMLDRETPRIRALEATLRVQYEDPSRAEAETMALAEVTKAEMQLLRAQRLHEQSYLQASTALLKFRKQIEASRGPGADPPYKNLRLACPPLEKPPAAPAPAPPIDEGPVVARSEHRSLRGTTVRARPSKRLIGWMKSATFTTARPGRFHLACTPKLRPSDRRQGREKPAEKRTRDFDVSPYGSSK